ncbi:MAG TPA: aminoacyl-tRNA hydrolase [Gemmataceae bacterium]|jgi:PTH1 family peptidyl-tRNA hydrolase|nr:aminoacyl-tRNA hydrolase [Gemmataceae bacterium]
MKLVVGLGNPGSRYQGTRHNVGFEVIDRLADGPGAGSFHTKFKGQLAELREENEKVLLVKPETFMNLSGQCVRQFVDFYQIQPEDLLVICDDVNLPLGKLRARAKGSHGGHNGLRDIQAHLGTTEYARLRIGVGAPEEDLVDYVLGRFRPSELPIIKEAIEKAVQSVVTWISQGIEECMNQYNAEN